MIELVVPVLGSGVLFLGLALASIGLYGMLRHPDIFEQLHAAGLVTGPGVIVVLLASLGTGQDEIVTSALLVIAFILVTGSLSTHVIALAAWRRRQASARPTGVAEGTAPVPMRVILAHDGSSGSDLARELAAAIPWPAGSRIRLVAVTEGDLPALSDLGRSTTAPRDDGPRSDDGPAPLTAEAAARLLQRSGLEVDHVVRGGDPATEILNEADAFEADLIIVGTRGLGRVRAIVSGSVASGVLDGAPCPVLVARSPRFQRVLLATDGSRVSDGAIEAVATWPMFEGADIQVLSVATVTDRFREIPPMRAAGEAAGRSRHRRHSDAAVARLREAGRKAIPYVRVGDEADRIAAFADAESSDLIVLGSRGRTGLRRTLLGSVARDVLASTEASVLVVRTSQ
jgi:monovalent cation/proton antiporter MnhG/PhaG subunit